MKFVTDANLGRLAKWLRILGYDTVYWQGDADRSFLREAAGEGRVVLTRKRDLARRQYAGSLIVIEADRIEEQLRELLDKLALPSEPARLLCICLRCNEILTPVSKSDVEGLVPPYVFETNEQFRTCPRCGAFFWPGTHRENIERFLRERIPSRRP